MKLGPGEIHVWYWDEVLWPEHLQDCFDSIAEEAEKQQCARFLVHSKRQEFMAARVFVRSVLSRYASVPPHQWTFARNQHGAPEIQRPRSQSKLRFNLAHTSGLMVMAVARERDVGIDAEWRNHEMDVQSIARTVFSPAEIHSLNALPQKEALTRFYAYWTLKEAYIKARRAGFSLPTKAFTMHLAEEIRIRFDGIVDDPTSWQFQSYQWGQVHAIAIAYRKEQHECVCVSHYVF